MKARYQNFVFDLYGTLVDIHTTEGSPLLWRQLALYLSFRGIPYAPQELRQTYLAACAAHQTQADDALRRQGAECPAELEIRQVWRELLARDGVPADDALIEDFCRLFRALSIRKLRLFPDTLSTLTALREAGRNVFLLSNAQAAFTRPELKTLGLEGRFDGILLSSEEGCKKPSPAFFGLLSKRFGLKNEETVMTGNDFDCDCLGAQKAGIDSCFVFTGCPPRPTEPLPPSCREIARLSDLLQFI